MSRERFARIASTCRSTGTRRHPLSDVFDDFGKFVDAVTVAAGEGDELTRLLENRAESGVPATKMPRPRPSRLPATDPRPQSGQRTTRRRPTGALATDSSAHTPRTTCAKAPRRGVDDSHLTQESRGVRERPFT